MVDRFSRSLLVDHPAPDGSELVSEVLAQHQVLLHPAAAAAAESLGASTWMLAMSLAEPRTLRTPEAARRALEGLHDLVLGAATAVEAVGRAVSRGHALGETVGAWDAADAAELASTAADLLETLPALARAARIVGRLSYVGPGFATETQRTHGLVAELERAGATVTYDPTAAADYHETDAGGGWLVQFTLPPDPRTFQLVTGDIALDISPLPLEVGYRDVHPALAVAYVLAHREDFLARHAVDPSAGDSGWIPPLHGRQPIPG